MYLLKNKYLLYVTIGKNKLISHLKVKYSCFYYTFLSVSSVQSLSCVQLFATP